MTSSDQAILVKASRSRIQACLKSNRDSMCYFKGLNGSPRRDVEGMKILYSDGERVLGQSVVIGSRDGEIKFSPLEAVRRPLPESPPEKGFKYVELDEDELYCVELMGVPHFFRTLDKLILELLEKRPATREDLDLLCHIVWSEGEGLDLNKYSEYRERVPRSEVSKIRRKYQVRELQFPPRSPEEVKNRYKAFTGSYRHYDSVRDYAFKVRDYYNGDLDFRPGDYFEKEQTEEGEDKSDVKKRVKEAVNG